MKPELIDHFQSRRLSIEERIANGKELRLAFPRKMHGEYGESYG
jgi:hypothetical protein